MLLGFLKTFCKLKFWDFVISSCKKVPFMQQKNFIINLNYLMCTTKQGKFENKSKIIQNSKKLDLL